MNLTNKAYVNKVFQHNKRCYISYKKMKKIDQNRKQHNKLVKKVVQLGLPWMHLEVFLS